MNMTIFKGNGEIFIVLDREEFIAEYFGEGKRDIEEYDEYQYAPNDVVYINEDDTDMIWFPQQSFIKPFT